MKYKCKQFNNGKATDIAEFDITEDKEKFNFKVLSQPNLVDYTNDYCESLPDLFKDFTITKAHKKDMQVKVGYTSKVGQLDAWRDKSLSLFHYRLQTKFIFIPN